MTDKDMKPSHALVPENFFESKEEMEQFKKSMAEPRYIEFVRTRNKLTVIGGIGQSVAYLNVDKKTALERFNNSEYGPYDNSYMCIEEFEFIDEFFTYSANSLDD